MLYIDTCERNYKYPNVKRFAHPCRITKPMRFGSYKTTCTCTIGQDIYHTMNVDTCIHVCTCIYMYLYI